MWNYQIFSLLFLFLLLALYLFVVVFLYYYYFVFSYRKNTDKENRANSLVGIKSGRLSIVIRNPVENLSISGSALTGGISEKYLLGTSLR
ncbi:unnamed protein product [Rotaria sp. Silwood2]|nr:unnamed protein product [Rotaria sp. Silwood2]CAF3022283.1 unnamed protein product [Rotaria sp. Silwood2]CAF3194784.1 unnamed protein product [Rotaria sp. Silwood2]